MRVRNQTTVVLSEAAQKVKDELAPIFGLKTILSTGLVLLSKLSSDEQKAAIAEANKPNSKSVNSLEELEKILQKISDEEKLGLKEKEIEVLAELTKSIMAEPKRVVLKGKDAALRIVSAATAQFDAAKRKQKGGQRASSKSS